jgi:hypothetical protein
VADPVAFVLVNDVHKFEAYVGRVCVGVRLD